MTDKVIPSVQGDSNAYIVAQLIRHGANTDGWIQPSSSALLADNDADITGSPLNAFNESHSGTSYDVTIDTGEGFVGGAWLARDTTTTVTLSSSTNNQTVYLGWSHNQTNTVVIGKSGAFAAEDPKIAIWEFDTDGSGVTNATDKRRIGSGSTLGQVTTDAGSEFNRFVKTAVSSTTTGTAGNSNNEVWRAPGSNSDLLMSVTDGSGRMNIAWNCYYDGADWRYITGSEPAYRVTFGTSDVTLFAASGGTADNIITFESFSLGTSGDVTAGANKMWDNTNSVIPQSNLGGPPASLSSYPLPAGDISDGSGSNLDADLVDGYHASDLQGGQWTTIESWSTGDTSTTLGYDSGTLATTYDLYRVDILWVNQSSNPNYLTCRLNGDGTSNYNGLYIKAANDGVYRGPDKTEWQNIGKVNAMQVGQSHLRIRGTAPSSTAKGENFYPTISADFGGSPDQPHLVSGELTSNHQTVDRIQIDSDLNATGELKLLGMSIN